MNLILITLIAALAFLTGIALHYFLSLRGSLRSYEKEIAELKKIAGPARAAAETAAPWIRMVVEIKDPIALAHRESSLAKMASGTAPNLVIKKVYEQVVAETRERFESRKIEAVVSLIVL